MAAIIRAQPETQLEIGPDGDRASIGAGGLRGVCKEIGKDLHHLIRIRQRRGQRRIVFIAKTHACRRAQMRRHPRPFEQIVNVDRPPVGGAQIAELFDLFQKIDDPAGFLQDHVGQLPILLAKRHRQQLGRAGDAGQRVLDLVGQHVGQPDRRAGSRLWAQCTAKATLDLARMQQHQHGPGTIVAQRRNLQVAQHRHLAAPAGGHIMLKQIRLPLAGALQQGRDIDIQRQAVSQNTTRKRLVPGIEKAFGCRVDLNHPVAAIDDKARNGQGLPYLIGHGGAHAACLAGGAI